MLDIFQKQKRGSEESFWKEFIRIKSDIENAADDEHAVKLIGKALHRYEPNLAFEARIDPPNSHLVISAEGDLSLFPSVIKLVENAPKIEGWKITPFRPRMVGFEVNFPGTKFSINEESVFFKLYHSENTDKKVDLAIFIDGLSDDENEDNTIKQLSFIYLDMLFGEYDVATHIGIIEWYPLTWDREGLLDSKTVVSLFDEVVYPKSDSIA